MKRIRAGEDCKCLMCVYELFEHEDMIEMVWMRKFKTNAPVARQVPRRGGWASRPEIGPPPFVSETLGFRSIQKPVVREIDPATISDNDFCRGCGGRMAAKDVNGGKCQTCLIEEARRHIQSPEDFEGFLASSKNMDPRIYPEFQVKDIEWDSVSMDCNDSEIAFEDLELDGN